MLLRWYERYAWVIFVALGFITVFQTAFIFHRAQDNIAVLAGYAYLGFGLITFGISFKSYSLGRKWAWYALWYVPTVYITAAYQHAILGVEWQAFALPFLLSLLALLLPYRRFFGKLPVELKRPATMLFGASGLESVEPTPAGPFCSLKASELRHPS